MTEPLVTVVMPVKDGKATLIRSVRALGHAVVELDARMLICDCASSDGTERILDPTWFPLFMKGLGIRRCRVLSRIPPKDPELFGKGQDLRNSYMCHLMAKFREAIAEEPTEFVFSLDADVIVPEDGLCRLLAEIKSEHGAFGIDYAPPTDHVRRGCTLYRWEAIEPMKFRAEGCVCRWIHHELERQGWKAELLSGIMAEHLREV